MQEGLPTETSPDHGLQSEAPHPAGAELRPGDRVGHYLIRQRLGEGGFAVVYCAEQSEPIRRQVALKIIKLGMDTTQVIARFEAERQALAMMDHPHVARVFDAGATETGRPYFVMELVPGTPITAYCDKHRVDINGRLDLFIQVCDAVQHAHQKGIIHRDLKPSNVLVADKEDIPVVKVIDFGVAKAISHRLTEKTIFTTAGQLIGTPEYMSPEQAEMTAENIDTRSDIYSMGVLLYELLVGTLPYHPTSLRHAAFNEIQRIIREDEPPKPSHRLSSLGDQSSDCAAHRRADPRSLVRELRGDLDWITMKALDKERTRRYATASELAADIRRHLEHQPVEARPPSVAYRARKFVRRHQVGTAAAAFVALALILGIAGTTAGLVRAKRAEAATQREAEIAVAINGFLQKMLSSVDPDRGQRDMKVTEVLGRAASEAGSAFGDQPEVEAAVRETLGNTYWGLGRLEDAETQLALAIEIRKGVLGRDHLRTLEAQNSLGVVLRYLGKFEGAEALYDRTLAALRRTRGNEHPATLHCMNNFAVLFKSMGRLRDAERLHREVLEIRRRVLGNEHEDTASSMTNLAGTLGSLNELEEAEQLAREALQIRRRVLGPDHPRTLQSMHNLAIVLQKTGRLAEAEQVHARTLEAAVRVFGAVHPHTLASKYGLAKTLISRGKFAEAEPVTQECYQGNLQMRGIEHPETVKAVALLVSLYEGWNRPAEADSWREKLPPP